jgi:hypothetical protein
VTTSSFGDEVLGMPIGRLASEIGSVRNNDYWIRDEGQFERVHRNIENNPVRSGLVVKPADYRWSRANAGSKAVVAG